MKKIFFAKIIMFLICGYIYMSPFQNEVNAQGFYGSHYRFDYFGIAPMVLLPVGVKKGDFDFNVLPFLTTSIITDHIETRTTAFLNIGHRSERENGAFILSSMGGEIAMPVFFTRRIDSYEPSEGFYIAPGFRYLFIFDKERDKDYMYELGFFAEPGYSLRVFDDFSVAVGLQLGKKYMVMSTISGVEPGNFWLNYISLKLQFGLWI